MTKDMNAILDKMTAKVISHLKNIGAVRNAENENPGDDFGVAFWTSDRVGIVGLEELFNIPPDLHQVIINRMILKGYDPVQTTAGLYLGLPGEEAKEFNASMKYIRTKKSNMKNRIMALGKVEKLSDLERHCAELGLSIKGLLVSLEADNAQLPSEVEAALLMSGAE